MNFAPSLIRWPLLVSVASGSVLLAQSASTRPAVSAGEVVTLSPFEVSVDSSHGYSASQTLSGTRVRSDVRDLASALTVLTPDFLNDIGATDFESILDFIPSTERFTVDDQDTIGNGGRYGTQYNVRGLRGGTLSTNFFLTAVPLDRYNLGQITSNRGPNSILFGTGAPGGLLDTQTKQAVLDRASTEVEGRYKSVGRGLYRNTIDLNLALMPKKLALRLATLVQDGTTEKVPTKDNRVSGFLTATYKPFAGTTVRTNADQGRIDGSKGRSYIVHDWYTPWVAAGRPTVAGTGTPANRAGLEQVGANTLVYIEGSDLPLMNWGRAWRGARPVVNGVANPNISFQHDVVVPVNTNVAGLADGVQQAYGTYSAFVDQKLADNLYLELGGQYERVRRTQFDAIIGADYQIQVDAAQLLPDGRANPYVGLPYIESSTRTMNNGQVTNRYQSRAMLSYALDFTQRHVRGIDLGRYALSGLWSYSRTTNSIWNDQEVNTTPAPGFSALLDNANNRIHRRFYLQPNGPDYFVGAFRAINQSAGTNAAIPAAHTDWIRSNGSPQLNTEEVTALGFVGQAFLFKSRLVVTYGVRQDASSVRGSTFPKDSLGVFASFKNGILNEPVKAEPVRKSLGAVWHLHRNVSAFANRSDNFTPPSANILTIFGQTAAPTSGQGVDTGLKFDLLGGRLTGSVGYFVVDYVNQYTTAVNGAKPGLIQSIWDAIDPSRAPPSSWMGSRDASTQGYELELVFNPTREWRIALNGSKNKDVASKLIPEVTSYVALNRALWQANAAKPAVSSSGSTVGQVLAALDNDIASTLAEVGREKQGEREWAANFISSYQFSRESRLSGWTAGGAARWRSAPLIGYRLDAKGAFDNSQPFSGKAQTIVDGWISYRCRLNRATLLTQLRLENLLKENAPYVYRAIDDGHGNPVPTTVLVPTTRTLVLSATLSY